MQGNGYQASGHGAFANGMNQPYETNGLGPRPLTVDEALPYSPFASVVPFNSGKFFPASRREPSTDLYHRHSPYPKRRAAKFDIFILGKC